MIFRETRHHAQVHVTSGALVHYALSLAAERTRQSSGVISLAIVCYGYFCWGFLLLFLFFFFLKIIFQHR
jgi:hypothetical protein